MGPHSARLAMAFALRPAAATATARLRLLRSHVATPHLARLYATAGSSPRSALFAAFDKVVKQRSTAGTQVQIPDDVFLRLNGLLDVAQQEVDAAAGDVPSQYASHLESLSPAQITWLGNSLLAARGRQSDSGVSRAALVLAARLYAVAADQGDHNAAYAYAQLLRQGGPGVEKDTAKAESLLTNIAKRGHPWAQYALGVMCFRGESGTPDFPKALSLLRTAASNGIAPAFNMVGVMYMEGKGVDADSKAAVHWFRKGADAGDAQAHMSLARCYGDGKGVEQSFDASYRHHLEAANKGLPSGMFNVGNHYFMGKGVGQSFETAAEWYQKAADLGFAFAQVNLGNMCVEGRGVPRDLHRARDLYAAAAAAGNPHAKLLLLEVESEIRKDHEKSVL